MPYLCVIKQQYTIGQEELSSFPKALNIHFT